VAHSAQEKQEAGKDAKHMKILLNFIGLLVGGAVWAMIIWSFFAGVM
jgi:hypothetical protein